MKVKIHNKKKRLPISLCVKIKGNYYEKNIDAFLMPDMKWYRKTSPMISYDYELCKYRFIEDLVNDYQTKYGIVEIKDGKEIFGYFTQSYTKNVKVDIGSRVFDCIDSKIALKKYRENESNGVFEFFENKSRENIRSGYDNVSLEYGAKEYLKKFQQIFDNEFIAQKLKTSLWKELPGNVTLGIEHETKDGRIPERLLFKNGLIPLKDGSLRRDGYLPIEYASVVLSGKNGISAMKKHCQLLNRYCKIGLNSTHVNIGGYELSKEYVYSLYLTVLALENEIYDMFPKALRHTAQYKGKDYCSPLKKFRFCKNKLDENFGKIVGYIAMNNNYEFKNFKDRHPADPRGNHKWDLKPRYHLCNFTPLLFGDSGVVEWRIHTSTFNFQKLINWVYITIAISEYAFRNKDKMSKESKVEIILKDVINSTYKSNFLKNYLIEYIEYRKNLMSEHEVLGDVIGNLDIESDNLDNFDYKVKTFL